MALLVGVMVIHAAGALRAQESPLVPPWGRDLEKEGGAANAVKESPTSGETTRDAGARGFGLQGEYLLWWTKNGRIPPLLTTGSTADGRPGALDQPFTKVLYGDTVDFQDRHGGRFTIAIPLNAAGDWSVSANYLLLGARDVGPIHSSPGNPVLARPFFDVVNQREDASLIAYPGVASGSFTISTDSFLHGAEGNVDYVLWRGERCRVNALAGLRYLGLYESIGMLERTFIDPNAGAIDPALAPIAGARFNVADRFAADNDFFGGQLGLELEWREKRWIFNLSSKVAVGSVHESITVRGRTTADTVPALDEPAGLLALATNSGSRSRNEIAVAAEVAGRLGLRVGEHWTLFGGYTFLYWNRVVRPGDQIDRNLNPNLIPTSATFGGPAVPAQPAPLFRTTDWWAQGLTLGVEFRY